MTNIVSQFQFELHVHVQIKENVNLSRKSKLYEMQKKTKSQEVKLG